MAKSELYGWLKQPAPGTGEPYPTGWAHDYDAGQEYFAQLTAEVFQYRVVKGFRRGEWVKRRERNEALDTFIGNRACAEHLGISRFSERDWRGLERFVSSQPLRSKPAANEESYIDPPDEPVKPDPPPAGGKLVRRKQRTVPNKYLFS